MIIENQVLDIIYKSDAINHTFYSWSLYFVCMLGYIKPISWQTAGDRFMSCCFSALFTKKILMYQRNKILVWIPWNQFGIYWNWLIDWLISSHWQTAHQSHLDGIPATGTYIALVQYDPVETPPRLWFTCVGVCDNVFPSTLHTSQIQTELETWNSRVHWVRRPRV